MGGADKPNFSGGSGHEQADALHPILVVHGKIIHEPAAENHRYPVCQGHGFAQVSGDHQDPGVLPGSEELPPDLLGGGDVQSLGGLLGHYQPGVAVELPGQDQFLQVAAGQPARLDVEFRNFLGNGFPDLLAQKPQALAETLAGGQTGI